LGKITKLFKRAVDPLGIVLKDKKKKVSVPATADAIAKQTALAETAARRKTSADRLVSHKKAGLGSADDSITRPGARSSTLFGD
jgi:hypothetical protein